VSVWQFNLRHYQPSQSLDSRRERGALSASRLAQASGYRVVATYRVYFRNRADAFVGRDDFEAEDDAQAMIVARKLRDACSDISSGFQLWQQMRRVDKVFSSAGNPGRGEATRQVQSIVLEREVAIRDSHWSVAESSRLLEQTQRLLDEVRQRLP
jgi:hypothetical protein